MSEQEFELENELENELEQATFFDEENEKINAKYNTKANEIKWRKININLKIPNYINEYLATISKSLGTNKSDYVTELLIKDREEKLKG